MALYRKYRPTSFDQAVGQEHITKTLQHAIKSGKISHAYLFTGPRGIGKTSVARILAREVNELPYNDASIHLDIIEIDAASNRRIDEIRELRDKVHITPTSAKYKVYIIDEVHMLTKEAFNALLKTLEEPPAHCIFILATTEVHKLPETIISRTQRFSFIPVSTKIAAKHLGSIAKKEKIDITDDALELLAEHGQGSFRDSISLLDQLSNTKNKITDETVRELLGLPAEAAIKKLVNIIQSGDSALLLGCLDELSSQGVNAAAIARELGKQLRQKLMTGDNSPWISRLLRELLEISSSAQPAEALEIILLEAAAQNSSNKNPSSPNTPPAGNEPVPELPATKPSTKAADKTAKIKVVAEVTQEEKPHTIEDGVLSDFDIKYWPQIVEYAKNHAASLYTALKLARPVVEGGTLILYFQFPLHQKKLNQAQQKDIIGRIIEEVAGAKVKIECQVNKEMFSKIKIKSAEEAPIVKIVKNDNTLSPVKSISNIFGSAEVLESN
jgi:DNA polymerase-3 subunit gamma/tau